MTPKLPPWRKRIQFCHSPMVPDAAISASTKASADVDPARVRPHVLLVAAHQLVLLGQDDVVARDAVAHHEVHPQHGEEDRPEHAEQSELDHEQRREDVVVADGGEPEAVRVDACERAQRHQQDDEHDDEADQPPAGSVSAARRGVSGQVAGDAHGGTLPSATPAPTARHGAECGRQDLTDDGQDVRASQEAPSPTSATRQRHPEWAGGWAWPVGNVSLALTEPARALSSQSEQPAGGRDDPAQLAFRCRRRPPPPRTLAWRSHR